MNYLNVSEQFYSVQGEGATMGIPAIFIRLGGCNLLCESEHWRCDTIEVWRKSKKVEYCDLLDDVFVEKLRTKKVHLIWTGGEPLLQQGRIYSYLLWFEEKYNFKPICEIETNGTIYPTAKMYALIDHWNVSPKLSNSGEPKSKRYVTRAIRYFARASNRKVIFKFVINQESDMDELFKEWLVCMKRNVYLMPAGEDQEQLSYTRPLVLELCKYYNLKFSDRLHIVAWNKKTGV